MRRLIVLSFSFVLVAAAQINRAAVVAELNYARQKPQDYAKVIQQSTGYFKGKLMELPGSVPIMTNEGVSAVWEAVRALRATAPMPALAESAPLDRAADDLVKDQGPRGGSGHIGADGSNPWTRMQRHAAGLSGFGEAVAYGLTDARSVVIGLLVDDGSSGRGHRQILLSPGFRYVGVGYGRHATYQEMCVIDLAR
jgi:Uncharacterized protein with SCP/PR1 domains